ncbi:MAG: hypothetical protein DCC67_01800 [Planctomycetota bacterium]|nr:MAG: hypothetical protein DCC67_01800 [Planctomycetota bacterium]
MRADDPAAAVAPPLPAAALDASSSATDKPAPAFKLREGSKLIDAVGRFRQSGDALVFIDSQNREITGLPNLNLERIARTLRSAEEPEAVVWSVSGAITEFGGRNYVLIKRAVHRSATAPPPPEVVGRPEVLAQPAIAASGSPAAAASDEVAPLHSR